MAKVDEIDDCDLDELLNLLDDGDDNENKPEANRKSLDYRENIEQPTSNDTTINKHTSKPVLSGSSSVEKGDDCVVNDIHVDPLEKELLQMEQRMKKLKEEIKKKKNIKHESPNFTKISSVIDPNTQVSESVRYLDEEEKINLFNNLNEKKSEIHKGDTDSEDDEDNRNPFEAQMSSYGKEIKKRIAHTGNAGQSRKKNGWNNQKSESLQSLGQKKISEENEKERNTIVDPFSGVRIINPLISTAAMKEMMQNRRMIQMSSIASQLRGGDIEGDWVTIGVIVSKSDTKTSQKGTQYSIWQMSDLKDCTKVISLFLFAGAYKNLWKSYSGSVVGILNPQIMKDSNRQTDGRNVLTMSVNNQDKVLIMGTARDLGWCRGRNKEGSSCKQFVNKNICEFCIFHIQKEYRKMSAKRSEIQSSFGRVDPRKAFQNKVLGKDQVFYGGQLYGFNGKESAPRKKLAPATKKKDLATLSSLSMKMKAESLKEKDKREAFKHMTDNQLTTVTQVFKKNEKLGEMMLAPTPGAINLLLHKSKKSGGIAEDSSKTSQITPLTMSAKEFLKSTVGQKNPLTSTVIPKLGRGLSPGKGLEIEFSSSRSDIAKAKALSTVKKTGGLKAGEKNIVRNKEKSSKSEYQDNIKKRIRESVEEGNDEENSPRTKSTKTDGDDEEVRNEILKLNQKKSLLGSVDINSKEFLSMMSKKSSHTNLIKDAEDEEVEKYYSTLEKKEMLENKMASTMEVPTSAVICLKCKYKALSASDLCREEKHPFKVIKAMKRFFECRNCKRRTISLERLPGKPCPNCDQSSWQRVAMGKDKQGPKLDCEVLSLRGDELSHVSSCSNKVYLNI